MDKNSKTGHGGIVVNIGSSASARPQISTPIYTATKHAILGLTRSCGDNYHYQLNGVRVIAVCPSLLESEEMTKSNRFKSADHEKAWQKDIQGMVPQKYVDVLDYYSWITRRTSFQVGRRGWSHCGSDFERPIRVHLDPG